MKAPLLPYTIINLGFCVCKPTCLIPPTQLIGRLEYSIKKDCFRNPLNFLCIMPQRGAFEASLHLLSSFTRRANGGLYEQHFENGQTSRSQ